MMNLLIKLDSKRCSDSWKLKRKGQEKRSLRGLPQSLHETYSHEQKGWLMKFEEFMSIV